MVTGVLLTSCTFISFPVIPDPVSVELPVVPKSEGLILQDKTLSLKVSIPSGEGFVGVIWYQQDRELGRESIYIDEKLPEVTFKQTVDPARPHRVVLLYQKKIIRQYEYTPPKVEEPEKPASGPDVPKDKGEEGAGTPSTPPGDPPTDPPATGEPPSEEQPTNPGPGEENPAGPGGAEPSEPGDAPAGPGTDQPTDPGVPGENAP
ncbi:hypothetical protein DC3_06480 [Deinococcus cellulosilyticus NBRC 106333 = KACC 11606]|uniref:Uncharacterized protein n=2 Tax=Deinococcus cellulosilyticus TaxID=401558 RepID=A0A511MWQ3_DEIC1|nr:hypothetical protein DC3_06480 [Deinococcus cellulosilyticus NBRC 106333 = KACC 11606]